MEKLETVTERGPHLNAAFEIAKKKGKRNKMNIPDEIWLKTVNKNNMKGSIIDSHICALENLG